MNLKLITRKQVDELIILALPPYYEFENFKPVILLAVYGDDHRLQMSCFPNNDNPDLLKGYYQLIINNDLQITLKFFQFEPHQTILCTPANMADIYRLLFAIEDGSDHE